MALYAGVELGGTKCVCLLADGPAEVRARETIPTTSPEATLGPIEALLLRWQSEAAFVSLGIGSFGPVELDPGAPAWGSITTTPKPGWSGTDVARRLRDRLAVPTGFDTDVNGAALAEMLWGAGRGLDDFAYVTVGTGVGVGLVVGGRPTRGFAHCELGHVRIVRMAGDTWPGACPYHGDCVEGLAAGMAIAARLGLAPADLPDSHPVWDGVVHALGQLCHIIVCTAAPRCIAIGGGVVAGRPALLGRIEEAMADSLAGYMPLPGGEPIVVPPALGDLAGPLGAIAIAKDAAVSGS